LTEAVRRKPYSVLLFDEFEKAHPEVSNILLQILDEGKITDAQGKTISFSNCIIILTSNIGSEILASPDAADASGRITESTRQAVLATVARLYKPEFINRLDEQIVFNKLSPQMMHGLVDLRLGELCALAESKRITLEVDEDAKAWLAREGYSPAYGARAL
jgi:ATP-dependent Clp protease ATP-binding subunit ClpB